MIRIDTARTTLREFELADAPFVLELLNEPAFLRFIGDRGVRTLEDAERYIEEGPRTSYARHGHGLLLVERKSDRASLGMCGLVRRPALKGPDLGFAFLERHTGQGFAREAAAAVLAATTLDRVFAISSQDNERSLRLLEELEFVFERVVTLKPRGAQVALFTWAPLDLSGVRAPQGGAAGDAAVEGDYDCPSCGERIVVPLDIAAGEAQEYVEDCPVCCSPNVLAVHIDGDGSVQVVASAE